MTRSLPVLSNASLTFDDEFNTFTSSSNGSRGWMTTYPYGGESARTLPSNHEAEYYSDPSVGENPFSDSNGVLDITATPAKAGSNPYGLPYDSGLITTYKSFAQEYGIFEVRAELPAGAGLWPAFWMLPANNVVSAELDIFEVLGGKPGTLYASTHGSTGGKWLTDLQALQVANTSTGYHTYAVDWEPATITFYIDGTEVASAPTPSSMDSPMYMLLDLAVGSKKSWPGSPTSSSEFPASLKIDYVRAYATAATVHVSGTAAIKGVTPVPAQAAPVVLGTGPDSVVLGINEDAWNGNAEFTVSVDGKRVGGVQTVTALHDEGQIQTFTLEGNWGTVQHSVSIDFLNDAYGGTGKDRNLYVVSASYDGVAATSGALTFLTDGPQSVTVGSNADRLVLGISEDAWKGNAQFTVSVDGKQVGGVQTATALHSKGQIQDFTFQGNWGPGQHTVSVTFLNDAYGGTAATDRNLYVASASYDGHVSGGSLILSTQGTKTMAVVSAATYAPGVAGGTITSVGDDTIIGGSGALSVKASGPEANITLGSGAATISALAGVDTVTGGAGRLTFILGDATANVTLGSGAATFDIVNGSAGGSLSIHDLVPATDKIHLSGYQGSGIASDTVSASGTTIVLTDHTKIALYGIAGDQSIFA